MTPLSCPKSTAVYRPRRPEKTVLFEVIKKHYKTWFKKSEKAVPSYIDKEFKKYLQCGILAHGFACAHCYDCHQNFLIAFSCKGRGIYPSCNTRTMVETAAHHIENLIPCIPIHKSTNSGKLSTPHNIPTNATNNIDSNEYFLHRSILKLGIARKNCNIA